MRTLTATLNGLSLDGVDDAGVKWTVRRDTSGWWGSPQTSTSQTKKPTEGGAWLGQTTEEGRTVALVGLLVAPTRAAALDALDRLNAAAATMDAPFVVTEDGRTRTAMVRRNSEVMVSWESPTVVGWSVQLLAADPRLYGLARRVILFPPQSLGGLRYPLRYPARYQTPPGAQSTALLQNDGNAPSWPRFVVNGPFPGIQIDCEGRTVELSLEIFAGQAVLIDARSRTASMGGVDMSQYLTRRGWAPVPPGGTLTVSVLRVSGSDQRGWVDVDWSDTYL